MNKYREIAERAIQGKKELMPPHDGSVSQYQKRFEVFARTLQEVDQILKEIGNRYIKENNSTLEEVAQIQEINKELIGSIIIHFKSNK
jgi:hypothetical protein